MSLRDWFWITTNLAIGAALLGLIFRSTGGIDSVVYVVTIFAWILWFAAEDYRRSYDANQTQE